MSTARRGMPRTAAEEAETERERYNRYLCSREWAEKRVAVIARSGNVCERCFYGPVEHVHHLTYIRKYREELADLQGQCVPCHEFTHGKRDVDPIVQAPPRLFGRPIAGVYLAGKIRGDLWREEILGRVKYRSNWSVEDVAAGTDQVWLRRGGCPIPGSIWAIDYHGPFFVDAAGGHGGPAGPHGCGGFEDSDDRLVVDYAAIREKSLGSVARADLVFAWINRKDIAGTVAEVAYAYGLRNLDCPSADPKRSGLPVIVVATPPGFPCDDMAFVLGMADYRITDQGSPGDAWNHLWTSPSVRRRTDFPK